MVVETVNINAIRIKSKEADREGLIIGYNLTSVKKQLSQFVVWYQKAQYILMTSPSDLALQFHLTDNELKIIIKQLPTLNHTNYE